MLLIESIPHSQKDWESLLPKKRKTGNSLVVQWLGHRAFTAGVRDSIAGEGTKIPQAA